MVDLAMIDTDRRIDRAQRRTRFVELVGPAGAGKSTLVARLPERGAGVAAGPNLWGLPKGLLLRSAAALVPTIVASLIDRHPLRPAEIGQMVRMGALRRALVRVAGRRKGTIVMEEGPVFGLAWLDVHHSGAGRVRAAWRRRESEEWARRLDAVVRVDADDDVLARRIRAREKAHSVKHAGDDTIERFLERYRNSYDRILGDLEERGHLSVRTLRGAQKPIDEEAARLRAAIDEVLGES